MPWVGEPLRLTIWLSAWFLLGAKQAIFCDVNLWHKGCLLFPRLCLCLLLRAPTALRSSPRRLHESSCCWHPLARYADNVQVSRQWQNPWQAPDMALAHLVNYICTFVWGLDVLNRVSRFAAIRIATRSHRFQIARFELHGQEPFESLLRLYYFTPPSSSFQLARFDSLAT